jgi:hypothetical protein
MGFFDKLKQKSDKFFDSLQQNAIDKALAASKEKNKQNSNSSNKKTTIVNKMSELDRASKEIEDMLKEYE